MVNFHRDREFIGCIAKEIDKYCVLWGIKMDKARMILLAESVYERFKRESILDIVRAIREGSSGCYGTTYNNLTPASFGLFMERHLEKKYEAKEAELKKENEMIFEKVDYDAYKLREKTQPAEDDNYNNYKVKYFIKRIINKK